MKKLKKSSLNNIPKYIHTTIVFYMQLHDEKLSYPSLRKNHFICAFSIRKTHKSKESVFLSTIKDLQSTNSSLKTYQNLSISVIHINKSV